MNAGPLESNLPGGCGWFFLSHHYVSTFSSFFLRSPHTPGCVKFALDLRLLGASPRWTIAKGAICSAGWEWKAGGSRLMGSEILGPLAFAKRGSSLLPLSVSSSQPGTLAQCHSAQGYAESSRYLLDGDWKWEGAAGYVQEYWILEYPKLWPWKNGEREVNRNHWFLHVFAVSYSWQNRYVTKYNCCTLSDSRQQTWILTLSDIDTLYILTSIWHIFWHILFWCTMSATKDPSWFLNKNCCGFVAKRN